MLEHLKVIQSLFENTEYENILDLGSGKTSLGILLNKYPNSSIDAICYPGDKRKLDSIRENCKGYNQLIEMDICKNQPEKEYDCVLCHLLLGETLKFGNKMEDMLNAIFKIKTNKIYIIDYLEDTDINFNLVRKLAIKNNFKIEKEVIIAKEKEEEYINFIGKNYIGILLGK